MSQQVPKSEMDIDTKMRFVIAKMSMMTRKMASPLMRMMLSLVMMMMVSLVMRTMVFLGDDDGVLW